MDSRLRKLIFPKLYGKKEFSRGAGWKGERGRGPIIPYRRIRKSQPIYEKKRSSNKHFF